MSYLGETLQYLLKTLLVCGFVYLLVPNNGFKGIIRLVLGLIIISVLLQAIFRITPWFSQWHPTEMISVDVVNTDEIVHSGIEMREKWENFFHKQIQALISK